MKKLNKEQILYIVVGLFITLSFVMSYILLGILGLVFYFIGILFGMFFMAYLFMTKNRLLLSLTNLEESGYLDYITVKNEKRNKTS